MSVVKSGEKCNWWKTKLTNWKSKLKNIFDITLNLISSDLKKTKSNYQHLQLLTPTGFPPFPRLRLLHFLLLRVSLLTTDLDWLIDWYKHSNDELLIKKLPNNDWYCSSIQSESWNKLLELNDLLFLSVVARN